MGVCPITLFHVHNSIFMYTNLFVVYDWRLGIKHMEISIILLNQSQEIQSLFIDWYIEKKCINKIRNGAYVQHSRFLGKGENPPICISCQSISTVAFLTRIISISETLCHYMIYLSIFHMTQL